MRGIGADTCGIGPWAASYLARATTKPGQLALEHEPAAMRLAEKLKRAGAKRRGG